MSLQKLINIDREKISRYFKSHYFNWSSRDSGSWRISKLENQSPCSQKHSFVDITTCKILQLAYISEIISKLYDNLQTQQLIVDNWYRKYKFSFWPCNEFFINQACSVKNIGLVFSCVFINIDCFSGKKTSTVKATTRLGPFFIVWWVSGKEFCDKVEQV